MKKLIVFIVLVGLLLPSHFIQADELMDLTQAAGYTDTQAINRPKSSIVIDAKTGDVLWADNVDEVRDPASMSKMLALYLVFEAMETGTFSPETIVTATPTDQAIANIHRLSNNKIVAGVDYTVAELITATLVPSSNAATLMLARLVEPDPDLFIDKMNEKAKALGMSHSKFFNASGAIAWAFEGYYAPKRYDIYRTNETTVRDYAILTYYYLKNYPEILQYTGASTVKIKAGTPYEESFDSYNYSLPDGPYGIKGVTGLKTGSSPTAGFNLTATAKRGKQEIITVLMGVGDWSDQNGEYYRHPFANALMEKAFSEYDYKKILNVGKHDISGTTINLTQPVYATVLVDQKPILSFEDGILQIDNDLEKVSPLIAKEQQFLATKEKETKSTVAKDTLVKYSISKAKQILVVCGLIMLVLLALFIMREIRHIRYVKKRRTIKQAQELNEATKNSEP